MPAYLLTIPAGDEIRMEAVALDAVPTLEQLKSAVGDGYIEVVPRFTTILWGGAIERCVVFCNEHGKLNGMELNTHATVLWYLALQAQGVDSCHDHLFGPVAVIIGDDDFLRRL